MGNCTDNIHIRQLKSFAVYLGDKKLRWGDEKLGHLYDSSRKLYIKLNESFVSWATNKGNMNHQLSGTIYYENGDIYVGPLTRSFNPVGQGKMSFSNGNKYVGIFDDCKWGNWRYYDGEYGLGSFNEGNIEFISWQNIRTYNNRNYPTKLNKLPVRTRTYSYDDEFTLFI